MKKINLKKMKKEERNEKKYYIPFFRLVAVTIMEIYA